MAQTQRQLIPVELSIDIGEDQVNIHPVDSALIKSYTGYGGNSNITISNRNVYGQFNHTATLELEIPVSDKLVSLPDIRTHIPATREAELIVYSIIGAGGTGGYVIRDLLRYLQALKLKGDSRHFVVNIVDADIVEEKNLIRQNFIPSDIKKPKAEVLAKRYGAAFGIPVYAYTVFLERPDFLNTIVSNAAESMGVHNSRQTVQHVIVGCVDNHKARRTIWNHVSTRDQLYWVDSGNERTSGQVVCSYGRFRRNYNGASFSDFKDTGFYPTSRTYPLPTIVDIFPDILDPNKDLEGSDNTSCADRAMIEDQNIFINMTAAINVLNYLRQITNAETITSNAVYFDIKGLSTVELITPEYLSRISGRC